jgi:hypothetical protein
VNSDRGQILCLEDAGIPVEETLRPGAVSFLEDVAWQSWQKRLLALAVSVALGVIVAVISQETTGKE